MFFNCLRFQVINYLFYSLFFILVSQKLNAQSVQYSEPIWKQATELLSKHYYAPTRFDKVAFITEFCSNLEKKLPLVCVDIKEGQVLWKIKELEHKLDLKLKNNCSIGLLECQRIYQSLPSEWMSDYYLDKKDFFFECLNATLKSLDPHCGILTPDKTNKYLSRTLNLSYDTGVWVAKANGQITVQTVYSGSPAEEAGIEVGDILLKIDDVLVSELAVNEVQEMLESSAKEIALKIKKKSGVLEGFVLEKQQVFRPVIHGKLINGSIGYVEIQRFSKDSHEHFIEILKQLKSGISPAAYYHQGNWKFEEMPDGKEFGTLQSLIIDLRGNPGGILEEAVKIADEFLPMDVAIVKVSGNSAEKDVVYKSQKNGDTKLPVVVLINERSASAAEILAGSLQYYKRAFVVGQRTYGKGSVQEAQILPLSLDESGQIAEGVFFKYSIAEYFTAGVQAIQNRGVSPNLELENYSISENFIRLKAVDVFRENNHKTTLQSKEVLKQIEETTFSRLFYVEDPNQIMKKHRMFDFGLSVVVEFLDGEEVFEDEDWNMRRFYYRKLDLLKSIKSEQDTKLIQAFSQIHLDWTSGGAYSKNFKPFLTFVNFTDIFRKEVEEKGAYQLTLKNEGKLPAHRVRGYVDFENKNLPDIEIYWGLLKPGEIKMAGFHISKDLSLPAGVYKGVVEIEDENAVLFHKNILLEVKNDESKKLIFTLNQKDEKLFLEVTNESSTSLSNVLLHLQQGSKIVEGLKEGLEDKLHFESMEKKIFSLPSKEQLSNDFFVLLWVDKVQNYEYFIPLNLLIDLKGHELKIGNMGIMPNVSSLNLSQFTAGKMNVLSLEAEADAIWVTNQNSRLGCSLSGAQNQALNVISKNDILELNMRYKNGLLFKIPFLSRN